MQNLRYSVVMIRKDTGGKVYLSHNNRIKWCKRTAEKHLKDVSTNPMYTQHYSAFMIEED